jgi:hypothetical protein
MNFVIVIDYDVFYGSILILSLFRFQDQYMSI